MIRIYNAGSYVFANETPFVKFFRRAKDCLVGVTLARQSINRIKPKLVAQMKGDVIGIGGYDDCFKKSYTSCSYLNFYIVDGPQIDLVGDAEDMRGIATESLGGIMCVSVLEHIRRPSMIVSETLRCLRPGGIAFISVPWMFEAHMEPQDYHRFSSYECEKLFADFEILDMDYTNSYCGLIAHLLQHLLILRFTLGIFFFIADTFLPQSQRWFTQVSATLRKPAAPKGRV